MYCKLSCEDSLLFSVVSYVDKTSFMAIVILYSLINTEDLCCDYCNMFLGHPVEMPPVLAAALASSCSTRCTVPGKHQLQSPPTVRGGVIGQPKLYYTELVCIKSCRAGPVFRHDLLVRILPVRQFAVRKLPNPCAARKKIHPHA